MLLVHPEGFQEMVGMLFLGRIPFPGPLLAGRDHILGLALAELDPGAVADSVNRVLEVRHQLVEGSAVNFDCFLERLALVGDPVDPAMKMVAGGVTDIVLHVPDDDVVPVGHVERAVGTKLDVRGSEVLVGTLDQVLAGLPPHVILVILGFKVVLLHPEEADGIGQDVVTLPLIGKVGA